MRQPASRHSLLVFPYPALTKAAPSFAGFKGWDLYAA